MIGLCQTGAKSGASPVRVDRTIGTDRTQSSTLIEA
jgi:hypothetical protein